MTVAVLLLAIGYLGLTWLAFRSEKYWDVFFNGLSAFAWFLMVVAKVTGA